MNNLDVVNAARSLIGTPYHHQGRVAHAGLDCIGVVVATAKILNIPITADRTDYKRISDGVNLIESLEANLTLATDLQRMPGEVLVLWFHNSNVPNHVAVSTNIGMIHAHAGRKTVIEHSLDDWWSRRIYSVYRLRNVSY